MSNSRRGGEREGEREGGTGRETASGEKRQLSGGGAGTQRETGRLCE